MGSHLDEIPRHVRKHIGSVLLASDLPRETATAERVARDWLERKRRFERIVESMELEETDRLGKTEPRGCIALTVSGSLVSIGPLRKNVRTVHYTSIASRRGVPQRATSINSRLGADVVVGAPVRFVTGPIARSSPVLLIAATDEEIDLEVVEIIGGRRTRPTTRELIEGSRELELGEG